ncbi:MAG: TPM domain-containing protein [Lachnospiraceae bacterium]|nr:TPM domain-containing protein [Lachnospiraceae bacterium]
MKNSLGRDYLHTFKIPFIILAVLLVFTVLVRVFLREDEVTYVRTNHEAPKERVFDYADKLTDEEEEALREKIAAAEAKTGCDIVIVILEEPLKEYAKSYESIIGSVDVSEYVMVYADNFYDENKFGFDQPVGDGILLLDNWYREEDGGLYSWISTCGKVYAHYSDSMINTLMNAFIEEVQIDPASGYELFVDMVAREMGPSEGMDYDQLMPWWMVPVIAGIATIIFFFANYGGRKGKKTIAATTYVKNGRPNMRVKEDQFLTKTVTKRHIPKSSGGRGGGGGGFGGGHVSAGGHSHGGGGGRR